MLDVLLEDELSKKMSLSRLAKTGLFRKIQSEGDYEEIKKELILHRAVLDKALTDWFSDNPMIKHDVDIWLKLDNSDFIDACERAHLDPEKVFKTFYAIRRILKGNNAKFGKFTNRRSAPAQGSSLADGKKQTNEV